MKTHSVEIVVNSSQDPEVIARAVRDVLRDRYPERRSVVRDIVARFAERLLSWARRTPSRR